MGNAISLLASPIRVEVPFIKITIGSYSFGAYDIKLATESDVNGFYTKAGVTYPNFIKSLSIVKINGQVNQYTLDITYPVRPGDDPNFFEKVFSSVSNTRKIIFSYGDMSLPEYIYKNEQAIITKVTSRFTDSVIDYQISAISSGAIAYSGNHFFPSWYGKPSDRIKWLLKNTQYGLSELFYGMKDWNRLNSLDLIAGDDKEVPLQAKERCSAIDYLKYLVDSMIPISPKATLTNRSDGFYILTIHDEAENETLANTTLREVLAGPYFKVSKVTKDIQHPDAYQITIGYPTANIITSFSINNQENYSIYYNWQENFENTDYVERLNDDGEWEMIYSPAISSKNEKFLTRPEDKSWWSKVTKYPISATLEIRGLLRPALLMEYVNLDVLYYGKKHISSGLYIITKQVDNISEGGYKTTLSLTRIDEYQDLTENISSVDSISS